MKLITPVLLIIAIATPCAARDYPAACHDFTSFPRGRPGLEAVRRLLEGDVRGLSVSLSGGGKGRL
jgi:hypothetical protein